jgi:hypothetical protein
MIYMVICKYCRENVKPKSYFSWKGFLHGLGLFYLIYFISKLPHCPNCNFPMHRRNMVFAIHLPQYHIKLAMISVSQLIHFKDRVISASRKSYLNRKFDPSHSTHGSGHFARASCRQHSIAEHSPSAKFLIMLKSEITTDSGSCPDSQVRTFLPAPSSPDFCPGPGTRPGDRQKD